MLHLLSPWISLSFCSHIENYCIHKYFDPTYYTEPLVLLSKGVKHVWRCDQLLK